NKKAELPEGVSLSTWGDRSEVLKGRIELLLRNGVQGSILVLIILSLFLQPRLAFWVVAGVPFCFLGTLFMMDTLSLSINVISLFAFILVLGIVVDDAIVTAESAYATLEHEQQGVNSVIRGVRKVAVATVFGVITTMIAFLPMLFLTEGISRFFKVISAVVIFCLFFSIVESKLILPAHLRNMTIKKTGEKPNLQSFFNQSLSRFAQSIYQPFLHLALKKRYITISCFLVFLLLAKQLIPSGLVRFIFFPNVPSDYISVDLQMPPETAYKTTHDYALLLQEAGWRINEKYRKVTGTDINVIENLQLLSENDTSAELKAALIPSTDRSITSVEMAKWWRENLPEMPGIKSLSFDANAGHPSIPIDIQLEADDLETLRTAAVEIKNALRDYSGVFDIRDTFDAGGKEINVHLSAQGESMGIGQAELARQIRQAFFGAEIQRVQRGRHEVRVYARYPEAEREQLQTLHEMWVRLPGEDGQSIAPLSVVGTLTEQEGINKITRIDRHRVVNIQANVDKSRIEPDKIIESIKTSTLPQILEKHPSLEYRFAGESEDEDASLNVLYIKGLVMLMMIYAALAIPLKSYIQPVIIMSVIPFGLMGAIIGHFIVGLEISILSVIGMMALAGIVVNDSLVLVDYINQHVRDGTPFREAVAKSGVRRFRAVILTSATTFVGLLPLQLETSIQAQFLKPMAISVSFGVLFATIVTLFLVPALCYVTDDFKNIGKLIRQKGRQLMKVQKI
ncbi:MAG: efflux RND transporter permease subunit, partial [Pseudomonadales bacterium]|nr:efflux RND transporter permease subunit [Pseudomonadales bacterium]